MNEDTANKHELLRLNAGSWLLKNSARRWELMCEFHEQGLNWDQMGKHIERSASTAKRLWRRGWMARQQKVALCIHCKSRLTKITPYPSYIPRGKGVDWRCQRFTTWVVYVGQCPQCKTSTRSWPFKLYSYEIVWENVTRSNANPA